MFHFYTICSFYTLISTFCVFFSINYCLITWKLHQIQMIRWLITCNEIVTLVIVSFLYNLSVIPIYFNILYLLFRRLLVDHIQIHILCIQIHITMIDHGSGNYSYRYGKIQFVLNSTIDFDSFFLFAKKRYR